MNGSERTNGNEGRELGRPIPSNAQSAETGHSHFGPGASTGSASSLGEPLSIREVAQLLGCSVWTVRQRYLPQGLPHLRACSGGRIVFFREQVIGWILKRQQQKGGPRK